MTLVTPVRGVRPRAGRRRRCERHGSPKLWCGAVGGSKATARRALARIERVVRAAVVGGEVLQLPRQVDRGVDHLVTLQAEQLTLTTPSDQSHGPPRGVGVLRVQAGEQVDRFFRSERAPPRYAGDRFRDPLGRKGAETGVDAFESCVAERSVEDVIDQPHGVLSHEPAAAFGLRPHFVVGSEVDDPLAAQSLEDLPTQDAFVVPPGVVRHLRPKTPLEPEVHQLLERRRPTRQVDPTFVGVAKLPELRAGLSAGLAVHLGPQPTAVRRDAQVDLPDPATGGAVVEDRAVPPCPAGARPSSAPPSSAARHHISAPSRRA
jgi:hypothetical protein